MYEKAARSVAGHARDVSELDRKGLEAVPGVGKSIAIKIQEVLDHGSFDELDELRAHIPAGVRSLLDVPGLGPKRAIVLHDELRVSSIPELADAIEDHRLRSLPGFGAKTEEKLIGAIRHLRQSAERIPLPVALDLAEEILADLLRVPGVESAEYAGSLRRMRETIGDVDLLVASSDPGPVMEAFCSLSHVDDVLAHGTTKSSVLTTGGVQVDLRVVPRPVWGAALLYFTGSKAHNIRVREIAVRQKLKLSEYGLFHADDETLVVAETEEAVYERLGLPWIEPTLREDRGEIEAALAGRLPHVVTVSDLRGDLHTHTTLTDGLASLEDMVAAAEGHDYEYYAVTDHAPLLYMDRMTADAALEQRERCRELSRRVGMPLLHGTELNIGPDGSLDWDDEFLAGFDIVVASVHSYFNQPRDEMTRRLVRVVEHPLVNVLGHPTGRQIGRRPGIDFDADAVFEAAARHDTALEINSFPDRLDLPDELARRAREKGVRFSVSTDSHAVPHLDHVRFGVATAQRGWVEPNQVINTWPIAELRRFLRT